MAHHHVEGAGRRVRVELHTLGKIVLYANALRHRHQHVGPVADYPVTADRLHPQLVRRIGFQIFHNVHFRGVHHYGAPIFRTLDSVLQIPLAGTGIVGPPHKEVTGGLVDNNTRFLQIGRGGTQDTVRGESNLLPIDNLSVCLNKGSVGITRGGSETG